LYKNPTITPEVQGDLCPIIQGKHLYKNPTKTPEIQGDLCPIFQDKHLYKNLQESKKPYKNPRNLRRGKKNKISKTLKTL